MLIALILLLIAALIAVWLASDRVLRRKLRTYLALRGRRGRLGPPWT